MTGMIKQCDSVLDADIRRAVAKDLQDDVGSGDISSALLLPDIRVKAAVITREAGVICGVSWCNEVYRQLDAGVGLNWLVQDGDRVLAGQRLVELEGLACSLLAGERSALNWLQTLSGTATIVAEYVEALRPFSTRLLDTRKTIPGLRFAQKYAVSVGGGTNHRMGLHDAYLIKENHIMSCGSIAAALSRARAAQSGVTVEIEVEDLDQLQQAIEGQADVVMLDNFSLEQTRQAVAMNQGRVKLEVSGNVTLSQLADIAATGVDFISVGALTKHLRALDLSMRLLDFG